MPDPALSAALAEAYASAPQSAVILHTLEFRHSSFSPPIRVVLDHADHMLTLEASAPVDASTSVNFAAFAFSFTLPEVTDKGNPEIIIAIDNVSAEIIGYIDAAAQTANPIQVTYRPYLASDTSAPQMNPPLTLTVREIDADVMQIRARAGFPNLGSRKFPNETYTSERFPGLIAT